MSRADRAEHLHAAGANCAQCVACAFAAEHGAEESLVLRMATGFGGGMGRTGGACGALSGAILVLGLARGMHAPGEAEAKERAYALVRALVARFREANGALACRDLLGVDIGTPEGLAAAKARNAFATSCAGYIRSAVEILEGILAEER